MGKAELVTDEDLARARRDAGLRHRLVADHLSLLLNEIRKLRATRADASDCREVREGVKLAVQLAELLHRIAAARNDAA